MGHFQGRQNFARPVLSPGLGLILGLLVSFSTQFSLCQAETGLVEIEDDSYQGVRYISRQGVDSLGLQQSYHIMLLRLDNPSLRLQVALNQNSWSGAKQTLKSMADSHGAIAGINGDYWDMGTLRAPPQGTMAIDGHCYRAHPDRSAIAFSKDLKRIEIGRFGTWPISSPPDDCPTWVHRAIGAGPQFLFAGQARWASAKNQVDSNMVDINQDRFFGPEAKYWADKRDPQSAIGISKDLKTLILVACDGRGAGGAAGCRMMHEVKDILLEFGAHHAMKLDGGGSTTVFFDGAVVNNPSGGNERALANGLLIFSKPK